MGFIFHAELFKKGNEVYKTGAVFIKGGTHYFKSNDGELVMTIIDVVDNGFRIMPQQEEPKTIK